MHLISERRLMFLRFFQKEKERQRIRDVYFCVSGDLKTRGSGRESKGKRERGGT